MRYGRNEQWVTPDFPNSWETGQVRNALKGRAKLGKLTIWSKCPRNILFALVSTKTGKTEKIYEKWGGKSGKLKVFQDVKYFREDVPWAYFFFTATDKVSKSSTLQLFRCCGFNVMEIYPVYFAVFSLYWVTVRWRFAAVHIRFVASQRRKHSGEPETHSHRCVWFFHISICVCLPHCQGSHSDWKTWKNGKAFSSQGKVREFWTDWKSQGKVRENHTKYWKLGEFQTNIICFF